MWSHRRDDNGRRELVGSRTGYEGRLPSLETSRISGGRYVARVSVFESVVPGEGCAAFGVGATPDEAAQVAVACWDTGVIEPPANRKSWDSRLSEPGHVPSRWPSHAWADGGN